MSELQDQYARYYTPMQGLKMLPLGVVLILLALPDLGVKNLPEITDPLFICPLITAVVVAWIALDSVYRALLNHGKALTIPGWKPQITILVLLVFLAGMVAQDTLKSPVELTGIALTAILAYIAFYSDRWYYYLGAAFMFVLSFLPLLHVLPVPAATPSGGISLSASFKISFGVVIMICGSIDHLMLVRISRTAGERPKVAPKPAPAKKPKRK